MFTAFNERNDFSYAFEKIRNAISAPGENNLYAATELGLGILLLDWPHEPPDSWYHLN